MEIKFKIIVILMLSIPQLIFCQDDNSEKFNNSIGIKASSISGYGIFYNRKLSDNFNVQLIGLTYYLYSMKSNVEHKNFYYNLGLEIQNNILTANNFRLYLLAGGYYSLDDDKKEGNGSKSYSLNHSFNVGAGIAGEYQYRRFILSVDLGYKFFEDRIDFTENDKSYPVINRVTKVGLGIGIGFVF
jgi:hypothetical protein